MRQARRSLTDREPRLEVVAAYGELLDHQLAALRVVGGAERDEDVGDEVEVDEEILA